MASNCYIKHQRLIPKSPKQDKPKAKHPKTHSNQINKDQTQRTNIFSVLRKLGMFFIMAVSTYIPTNGVRGFPLLHTLCSIVCRCSDDAHSIRCELPPYPCHRLGEHGCVGLSLGFPSCSTDLCFYFCARTTGEIRLCVQCFSCPACSPSVPPPAWRMGRPSGLLWRLSERRRVPSHASPITPPAGKGANEERRNISVSRL